MKMGIEKLNQQIDELAISTVMLDSGDIPALGGVLQSLEEVADTLRKEGLNSLEGLVAAMKDYVEDAIMGEKEDMVPFEAGITQLQDCLRKTKSGVELTAEAIALPPGLADGAEAPAAVPGTEIAAAGYPDNGFESDAAASTAPEAQETADGGAPAQMISVEDQEIILDFVAESLENLGTIEVSLMDLEQDPTDLETLNAIFRPFHTVKGVSGFLNFNKINRLAHVVENLLDMARNGDLVIDGDIIDLILDSVDVLKGMIVNVQETLESGTPQEGAVDIAPMIVRVEAEITRSESGEPKPLGEMLVDKEAVSEADLQSALDIQQKDKEKKLGEILVTEKKVPPREVVSALREQKKQAGQAVLQVKVDTDKLDSVVDMVGELAIAQSMLRQSDLIKDSKDRGLYQITNQLNLITSTLQKTAMSLRMVPIQNTFKKMLRLVRDLAKKAGKEVKLDMSGQDTEIDRNMVEEIYEPMVHMIRNSVDHGLEPPDERRAAGKPPQGNIWLKAYHKGGDIVIEIADNGRGLDSKKILSKAIKVGLVKEGEKLTSAEIDNLIFHPGFSTADKVTDISGRGVGTDVVKSKIEKLRGRVEVQSNPGKGTTFFMRLPLTLAIVDGMIIKVVQRKYIIPTLSVQESFKPKKEDYFTVKGQGEMIKVRENLIPLVRLDRIFGTNGGPPQAVKDSPPWDRLVVVVENQERLKCLLIDELLGQDEVVIKSLGSYLKKVKGIAGGAIMGDGTVGLILDMAGIFDLAIGE